MTADGGQGLSRSEPNHNRRGERDQNVPAWLLRIQENSWEAEVLLSGLVLFSLLRAPDLLYNFRLYLAQEVIGFIDLWYFEAAGRTAIQFLTWGFMIHLVMRGIWVGFVGLSYAFPRGIQAQNLKFQEPFTRGLTEAWLVPAILRMERYCSVTFSVSLMFFLFMLGLSFFYLCYNWFLFRSMGALGLPQYVANPIKWIVVISVLLYFIDFFLVGVLRRIPKLSTLLYPVFWLIRWLCLTFTYEKIYLTFISNTKRWKLSVFLILVGLVGWQSLKSNIEDYRRFPGTREVQNNRYDNLRPPKLRIARGSIQADVVKGGVLKLFVTHDVRLEPLMAEKCELTGEVGDLLSKRAPSAHRCLKSFFQVFLDGEPVARLPWFFHTQARAKDFGYLTWIDIAHLKRGPHVVEVRLEKNPPYVGGSWLAIPFFRE